MKSKKGFGAIIWLIAICMAWYWIDWRMAAVVFLTLLSTNLQK